MVLSPEEYAEESLKGKSVGEIKAQIRSLKRKIRQLQKEIDNPNENGCLIYPDPEEELEMHCLYLQEAVKVLMDTIEYLGSDLCRSGGY